MLDCAKLYQGCDKVEKKLSKTQKAHYFKMGKILKQAKRKEPKFDLWKKDKEFLKKKQQVRDEIDKRRVEKYVKGLDIHEYIQKHFID